MSQVKATIELAADQTKSLTSKPVSAYKVIFTRDDGEKVDVVADAQLVASADLPAGNWTATAFQLDTEGGLTSPPVSTTFVVAQDVLINGLARVSVSLI